MLSISNLTFAVLSVAHVMAGTNIMLNKPSIQSGIYTHDGETFPSSNANNGNRNDLPSVASQHENPYWQGDLQGFYTVTSIIITSTEYNGWASYMKKAIIGVSVQDVDCSQDEVTKCGQWPDENLSKHTMVFNCSYAGPVRYVRIWRELENFLNLGEVEVEGVPSRLTGTVYDKFMQQKVVTPITSLSVSSAIGCGTMCHRSQPCLAFSYSTFEQPNCLLATDVTMTTDVKWLSYKIGVCVQVPSCDFSGFL